MLGDAARAIASDLPGAALVSAAILALFGLGEFLRRRFGAPVEVTRKLAHVGSGLVVLGFPWLLSSTWTVALMAVAFFGLLVAGKRTGLLDSVHGVRRRTGGAYYYPFAVLGAFWLAGGDPLLYCAPIAVMALADTGAALVGGRPGNHRYRVLDGHRSLEGSLTFFGLALGVLVVALALDGRAGWPEAMLVALVAAVAATATEAISVRGSDNLFIPYAVLLALDRTLRLGLAELSGWMEGMLAGLALAVAAARLAGATGSAAVAVFLVTTLALALGGWAWAAPMAGLVLVAALAARRRPVADLDEFLPPAVGGLVLVLAFGHAPDPSLFPPYLAALAASAGIAALRAPGLPPAARPAAVAAALAVPLLLSLPAGLSPLVVGGGAAGALAFVVLAPLPGARALAPLLSGALTWALLG